METFQDGDARAKKEIIPHLSPILSKIIRNYNQDNNSVSIEEIKDFKMNLISLTDAPSYNIELKTINEILKDDKKSDQEKIKKIINCFRNILDI